MASPSRTLTLKLLADITNFNDNLGKGNKSVETLSTQIGDFSKKAALAFAAVGAAALAYAKQAVEAAAADEQAQIKLAATIEASTNASKGQIAEVERYITKTSIAIGITDDELRPAFARLVRSTQDVEAAQKLLNLALDLQAATGKPLEAITNALGKAYDGNTTALGKLGLGIDAGTLKSKDFNKIAQELDKTWGDFAENTANTTQKGLDRVRIAIDEANESIGMALLPVVQDLTAWILEHFVPALEAMIGGLTGDKSVKKSLGDTYTEFYKWGERIRSVINTVVALKDEIIIVAGVMAAMFVSSKIAAGVAATISTINLLIKAYNALKASAFVAGVAAYFALNPLAGVAATAAGIAIVAAATKYINGLGSDGVEVPASATAGAGILATTPKIYGSSTTSSGASMGNVPDTSGIGTFTTGTIGAGVNATLSKAATPVATVATAAQLAVASQYINTNTLAGIAAVSERPYGLENLTFSSNQPNTNTLAGIMKASQAPVVINVNGAIDPEGTARTIVDTLNNSFYRGTGGAGGLVTA